MELFFAMKCVVSKTSAIRFFYKLFYWKEASLFVASRRLC